MSAGSPLNGRTGIAAAAILATVGLGLTGAQTPTMAASTGMSEIAKLAAKGGVDALQQDLDARSPGARAPGALTQTKARRVASLKEMFGPKERVLSKERTRPGAPGSDVPAIAYETGNVTGPGPYGPTGPAVLPGGDAVVANLDSLPPAVGSYPISNGGGTTPIIVSGGGGGGGSGGGGGGGSGGGGGNTPGVGSPVPEPATWLSLMIGFFAIGFGLRGRRTRRISGRAVQ
ncbi:MAG: PEP-CTERM sorting domain-containing protein [Sphingomonas sp.]